ncbi:MAG: tRNA (adenosine(37)-N6)-threonylcarbamoyltransferase complex transferase subunit TsaD [Candidatus Moranbacteria bacterium]|nr:tRNA (adenosine(37)-N6)-threonylcarbamoyltransferase complex transferase subunit TsaD [Candidatus Moranbacteria bacterium]
MRILGIETSCDETAASVISIDEKNGYIKPLSNIIASQIKLHAAWGGVVPNLAAREHLKNILPVLHSSLAEAGLSKDDIDLIAVTNGPGLIPALLIGTNTAKTIAYAWQKPLLGIHHIEGHIYANFINKSPEDIAFPILCLVVSGGHTQLVLMKKHLDYAIIGETQDDAAGEAFDKVARILGLGYPGGPLISKLAAGFKPGADLSPIRFPRPMIASDNLNFSFSGLKTSVLYFVKKNQARLADKKFVRQIAYEFQQAVIDVLLAKTVAAAKIHKPKTVMLAGGVSANIQLQLQLSKAVSEQLADTDFYFPEPSFQSDNAAMIAAAAFFRQQKNGRGETLSSGWKGLKTEANLKL